MSKLVTPWFQELGESIDFESLNAPLHRDIVNDVQALQAEAKANGFDLRLASGFRSFARQLEIWNEKVSGKRAILDMNGREIARSDLDDRSCVFAILNWSALPGASRHHWGTDFDIYDACALGNKKLALTVEETKAGGVFEDMYAWLDRHLREHQEVFWRPYIERNGGVASEPWHLSHRIVATHFELNTNINMLRQTISHCPNFLLKDTVLLELDSIFEQYIAPYAER